MDYILTVALNYLFNVVLCGLKSDSQTFEFYRPMERNIVTTKTIEDHDKWIAIHFFFFGCFCQVRIFLNCHLLVTIILKERLF